MKKVTKNQIKKNEHNQNNKKKVNYKAWLFASTFSIISAAVGIINLILGLTLHK